MIKKNKAARQDWKRDDSNDLRADKVTEMMNKIYDNGEILDNLSKEIFIVPAKEIRGANIFEHY